MDYGLKYESVFFFKEASTFGSYLANIDSEMQDLRE